MLRKIHYFFVFLAFYLSQFAYAGVVDIYKGTIGKANIVLKTTSYDNVVIGKYYYVKRGLDIFLIGSAILKGNNKLKFSESLNNPLMNQDTKRTPDIAHWILKIDNKEISGTWKDLKKNNNLPIHLIKIASYEKNSNHKDEYDKYRLNFSLTSESIQTSKDKKVSYRYLTDVRNKISYPRILTSSFPKAIKLLNESLNNKQKNDIEKFFEFENELGNFDFKGAKIIMLNEKIFSLAITRSFYAPRAAYPNVDQIEYVSFTLNNGRIFDAKSIFKKSNSADIIKRKLFNYTYDKLGKTNSFFTDECYKLYNSDLPYTDMTDFDIVIQEDGLLFNLQAPHVAAACAKPILIPYAEINDLIDNDILKTFL